MSYQRESRASQRLSPCLHDAIEDSDLEIDFLRLFRSMFQWNDARSHPSRQNSALAIGHSNIPDAFVDGEDLIAQLLIVHYPQRCSQSALVQVKGMLVRGCPATQVPAVRLEYDWFNASPHFHEGPLLVRWCTNSYPAAQKLMMKVSLPATSFLSSVAPLLGALCVVPSPHY